MRQSSWISSVAVHGIALGVGAFLVADAVLTEPITAEVSVAPSDPSPPRPELPPPEHAPEAEPVAPIDRLPEQEEPVPEFEIAEEPRDARPDRHHPDAPWAAAARVDLRPPTQSQPEDQIQPEPPPERHNEQQERSEEASDPSAAAPWVEAVAKNTNRPPDYPARARARGEQGDVVLRVHIAIDGSVTRIDVVSSPSRALTRAALRAVETWRYEPARAHGVAVPSSHDETIRFELR